MNYETGILNGGLTWATHLIKKQIDNFKSIDISKKSLYQYKSIKNALKSIKSNSIYLGNPNQFNDSNDPFYRLLSEEKQKTSIVKVMNNFGVACLSKTYANQLLWSHYGDRHHGVCIKYKIISVDDCIAINNISYTKEKLVMRGSSVYTKSSKNDGFIQILFSKHLRWRYEQEVRIIRYIEKDKDKLLKNVKIKAVYLGKEFNFNDNNELVQACVNRNIKIFKMVADEDNLWTLKASRLK